jgi:tripartite-type tricarboxylate transporter receptor subunit TctC
MRAIASTSIGLVLALASSAANAQSYPTKPVRLIVPFTPGGSTDILGRTLAQQLTLAWKEQVVVENRPGAGGSIGADAVAKAAPDGYTLLMGHIGTLAVNVGLYPKLPYNPAKDFAPISLVAIVPNVLVVHPSIPVRTVPELVAYLRANPGKINYGSGGNGSAAHLAVEYFKLETKTEMAHIPYRGTGPMMTDLISGQVGLTMTGALPALPHVQSGKLRAIAVSSPKRVNALAQVPTIAESGVPGFDATQWYGVVAPAGTPREIVAKINADTRAAMQSKELRERLDQEGATAETNTPEQFGAFIAAEIKRWSAVVKAANMQPN